MPGRKLGSSGTPVTRWYQFKEVDQKFNKDKKNFKLEIGMKWTAKSSGSFTKTHTKDGKPLEYPKTWFFYDTKEEGRIAIEACTGLKNINDDAGDGEWFSMEFKGKAKKAKPGRKKAWVFDAVALEDSEAQTDQTVDSTDEDDAEVEEEFDEERPF